MMRSVPKPRELSQLFYAVVLCIVSSSSLATTSADTTPYTTWQEAANLGFYDEAVELSQAIDSDPGNALKRLIDTAYRKQLSAEPQWRAFIHYKPAFADNWISQVDSPHFFLSEVGKQIPEAELNATLAALFSTQPKPPLRLTAHCRFIARRVWLAEQMPEAALSIPRQDCTEFKRYAEFLDADVLTLVFPTAHPNSPSSAFGHTLLRIDKKISLQSRDY